MIRPKCFVEQFLDVLMRLVEIHGQFFLDDISFLVDLAGSNFELRNMSMSTSSRSLKRSVACFGVKAGVFLRGEGIEISADAFDILRNLLRRAVTCAFKQQMLDEMRDSARPAGS